MKTEMGVWCRCCAPTRRRLRSEHLHAAGVSPLWPMGLSAEAKRRRKRIEKVTGIVGLQGRTSEKYLKMRCSRSPSDKEIIVPQKSMNHNRIHTHAHPWADGAVIRK